MASKKHVTRHITSKSITCNTDDAAIDPKAMIKYVVLFLMCKEDNTISSEGVGI